MSIDLVKKSNERPNEVKYNLNGYEGVYTGFAIDYITIDGMDIALITRTWDRGVSLQTINLTKEALEVELLKKKLNDDY